MLLYMIEFKNPLHMSIIIFYDTLSELIAGDMFETSGLGQP